MAKVIITKALREEIFSKFKAQSEPIFLRMKQLEIDPQHGKAVGHVEALSSKS